MRGNFETLYRPLKLVDRIASRLAGSTVPNACVPRKTCSSVFPVWRKWKRNSSINRDSVLALKICSRRSIPSGLWF